MSIKFPIIYTHEEFELDNQVPGEVRKNARHWISVVMNPHEARRDAMSRMGILDKWEDPEEARVEAGIRLHNLIEHAFK